MTLNSKKKCGYSTLELLFYISLFALLSIVVIDSLVTMTKAFRETSLNADLAESGSIAERMVREIRQATGVSSISGTSLTLNTKDANGADKTVQFLLSGSNIQFLENNVLTGNLNPAGILVIGLNFTQINTPIGLAVKFSFTIRSTRDSQNHTYDFYDTAVLRGHYGT
ncbi:hypothetical protein A3I95_02055 [Candidatus Nomurabacteria bacterium RIFCSPLOWO2_02_FULL_44_12]|uniref:Uncharacterized protein n=1 Tax=Candidatus Nomurabacteria bacterium RIFCSPLOWO2_12_FULL_44_11 TaxID=1801796 RepID=A0A1F6Y5Z8_9BACT|nr:MAG: hypothetical protein A3E95_01965 [Candidatus Nomurabacteria bacterium RIFCSPHIGHO2_12_FULL_44_22b]OGJ01772.1 MAG: hypothetical protein A3G53_00990 [Candidatus Nomurabacteria bacterium RIFCSPLOWO2_12_FULL_44_11]OGJ07275.1 MAG: hypothetical protein A3I95_02055 [Candidatus Nomurabacteria bacterium RIFCSPLOWO2_02_FULL_44_12]